MGLMAKWLVYSEKSHLEMDDDWGYPYFKKPPYLGISWFVGLESRDFAENQSGLKNFRGPQLFSMQYTFWKRISMATTFVLFHSAEAPELSRWMLQDMFDVWQKKQLWLPEKLKEIWQIWMCLSFWKSICKTVCLIPFHDWCTRTNCAAMAEVSFRPSRDNAVPNAPSPLQKQAGQGWFWMEDK